MKAVEGTNPLILVTGAAGFDFLRFVKVLEKVLGKRADKNLMPLQPGDVPATYADGDGALSSGTGNTTRSRLGT